MRGFGGVHSVELGCVLAGIQVDLNKTGAEIDEVERGIQAAEERAEAAAAEGNTEERDYWREEEKQLREEKKQLQEEEQLLREMELVLLKRSAGMAHQHVFCHTRFPP